MRFLFVCIQEKRVGIAFESIDDADFGRLLVPFDALAFQEKNWFQVIHEPGQPVQPGQPAQVKISNENQWKGEIQTNPKSIQNQTLNNKALVLN